MRNAVPYLPAALVACAALAVPASARSRAPLYQWTDASGAVRYTTQVERIPADERGAAVLVAESQDTGRQGEPPAAGGPTGATPPAAPAPPPVETAPAPLDPRVIELDARIAELEKSIAADEAALADYISDPDRAKRPPESSNVPEIADRLPRLQSELRELRAQRAAAAGASAVPNAP
jgi:hypothetical protein